MIELIMSCILVFFASVGVAYFLGHHDVPLFPEQND